jgi:rhodanese-related sulfurtransferase
VNASGKILGQTLLVAVVGAMFAFTANSISPRGLQLSRNYFLIGEDKYPTNKTNSVSPTPTNNSPVTVENTNNNAPTLIAFPRLNEKGLQAIDTAQATRFFNDARRQIDALVFVDARNGDHYREGHIPGAYQLDPYHPEKYLDAVVPICQSAEVVVVYCTGKECEDSELSAILLRNIGIPNDKIFVYAGGFDDWKDSHSPIETGTRLSGKISK